MNDIAKLKNKLGGLLNKHSVVDYGSSLVPEIDYTEMNKKLKPDELGKERGKKICLPLEPKHPMKLNTKL